MHALIMLKNYFSSRKHDDDDRELRTSIVCNITVRDGETRDLLHQHHVQIKSNSHMDHKVQSFRRETLVRGLHTIYM